MARVLNVFRRFRFRYLILMLAAAYFLAMYIFHSDLQRSDGHMRDGWDRLDIGADASAAVRHNGPRAILRDSDFQQVFDNMRQNGGLRSFDSRLKADQDQAGIQRNSKSRRYTPVVQKINEYPEEQNQRNDDAVRKHDEWAMNSDMKQLFNDSLNDDNIPPGCQNFGKESEFLFQKLASDVSVFSAYWDSRPNDFDNRQNGTHIRIMAILRSGARPELFCSFGLEPKQSSKLMSPITYYEMCENHGRIFGGFILSCFVPTTIIVPPCWVTIHKFVGDNIGETVTVRMRTIAPQPQRRNFAICVPPLFGSINIARLVEFFEVSRILGAEHVTLYDFEMNDEVRSIIDYYIKIRGFVSVVPWKLDRTIDNGIWYHGQLIAIQDCLYRHMASTNHVVFNDIDEFVVPQRELHWSRMIQVVDKPNRCAFHFKSAFFRPESRDDSVAGLDLQTLLHFERTSNFNRVRTKCMVKPFSIFEKGIHHVSKPIWADLEVHGVETDVAFLHHYRVCLHGMGMNCNDYKEDKNMLRFKNKIISAVNSTNFVLKLTK